MKTNASVTIIKRAVIDRKDVYMELGTYPCHWEETRGINTNRTGRNKSDIDKVTCYIPNELLRIVDVEDLIIRNDGLKEIKQCDSFKEYEKLYNAKIVTVCDCFDFGSRRMRHTRIGAK